MTFPRCITPQNNIDQFSQKKNFNVEGVRNSSLVHDIIEKTEFFFEKLWQVTYQQMQNDPLSCSLLNNLVY